MDPAGASQPEVDGTAEENELQNEQISRQTADQELLKVNDLVAYFSQDWTKDSKQTTPLLTRKENDRDVVDDIHKSVDNLPAKFQSFVDDLIGPIGPSDTSLAEKSVTSDAQSAAGPIDAAKLLSGALSLPAVAARVRSGTNSAPSIAETEVSGVPSVVKSVASGPISEASVAESESCCTSSITTAIKRLKPTKKPLGKCNLGCCTNVLAGSKCPLLGKCNLGCCTNVPEGSKCPLLGKCNLGCCTDVPEGSKCPLLGKCILECCENVPANSKCPKKKQFTVQPAKPVSATEDPSATSLTNVEILPNANIVSRPTSVASACVSVASGCNTEDDISHQSDDEQSEFEEGGELEQKSIQRLAKKLSTSLAELKKQEVKVQGEIKECQHFEKLLIKSKQKIRVEETKLKQLKEKGKKRAMKLSTALGGLKALE